MSAIVTISSYFERTVEIPKVDNFDVTEEGRLRLRQGWQEWSAIFQPDKWESVVITPERGRDGRFIRKGA